MADRNGYRGYITSRPFFGERAPQHIQNLVIRDYAAKNDLDYLLSATEYAMESSHIMLQQVLSELGQIHGVICYSIFQLPIAQGPRTDTYRQIIDAEAVLHAAVEGLVIRNWADVGRVEDIWKTRRVLDHCATADMVLAGIRYAATDGHTDAT